MQEAEWKETKKTTKSVVHGATRELGESKVSYLCNHMRMIGTNTNSRIKIMLSFI